MTQFVLLFLCWPSFSFTNIHRCFVRCDLVFQLLSRLLPESYQGNVPSLTLTVSTLISCSYFSYAQTLFCFLCANC